MNKRDLNKNMLFLRKSVKIAKRKVHMIKIINDKLYQPMLFFFLLPLISLVPGTIFALQYGKINYVSFTALYIYIVVNQLIENILIRIPVNDFEESKKFLISLEFVNLLFILFFGLRYSWMNASILLLYTIIMQLQFLFSYYDLEIVAAIIASSLKVFLLNSLSFYIHTHFVHFKFSAYYFALFLPYLIYELARSDKNINRMLFFTLSSFSYLFPIILLWQDISLLSLSLLISYPFFFAFTKEVDQKYMPTFLVLFSIIYIALISLIFIM